MSNNSITIKVDQETWDVLDQIHKELGINKSTQVTNLIKSGLTGRESVIKANLDELDRMAAEKFAEAERLLKLKDDASNQKFKYQSGKFDSPKIGPKTSRTPSNVLTFTDDSVHAINHNKRDEWYFDAKTKGLAIRTKKHGKVYYTRAKNPKVSSYAIRVKIGDIQNLSLEQAKEQHKKNLDIIFKQNINPNTLNPNAKWTRDNVNVAMSEEEVSSDQKEKVRTDWALYSSLRYDDGLCFPILKAILKRHPEMYSQCKSRYMNKFYAIRGERILEMFKEDSLNVYEISKKEMISDNRSQHKIRRMSIQNVVMQLLKGFYWHGNKNECKDLFGKEY